MIEYRTFFGDGEKTFAFPTRELINELEHKTGYSIGAIFWRLRNEQFSFNEVWEVIRLGLIGGGTSPVEADRLVSVYCLERHWAESFAVALNVMIAMCLGHEADDDFGFPQDEPTADLASDMAAAYQDVAA